MKRLFLVEADTNYHSLFCYELKEVADSDSFEKVDGTNALFNGIDREQFFGNLNSLCVTKPVITAPKMVLKPADIPHSGELISGLIDTADKTEKSGHISHPETDGLQHSRDMQTGCYGE
jgi:hypothetical protein